VGSENVELIKRAFDAFRRGELTELVEIVDPEIEWHEPAGAVRRGHAELLASWQAYDGKWKRFEVEPRRLLDAGDHVVVTGLFHARARDTGTEVEIPFAHVYRLRDGRVVEGQEYVDTLGEHRALAG
jgi:ketosteroid isomerase-like protein